MFDVEIYPKRPAPPAPMKPPKRSKAAMEREIEALKSEKESLRQRLIGLDKTIEEQRRVLREAQITRDKAEETAVAAGKPYLNQISDQARQIAAGGESLAAQRKTIIDLRRLVSSLLETMVLPQFY